MDSKEVYLEIFISYDGKDYQKKSNEFIKFEELKSISIKEFNILEEDSKYIKYNIKESENKIISIENDIDILNNMKKIDDYNYEIKLNLSLDKNNLIQEEIIKEEINLSEKNMKKNDGVKNLIILFYKKLLMKERMERRIERVIENKIKNYEKINFQPKNNMPLNNDIFQDKKDVIFNDDEINKIKDKIKKSENYLKDLFNNNLNKIKALKEESINTINNSKNNLIDNNKVIYKEKLNKILYNIKEFNNKIKQNENKKFKGQTPTPLNSKNFNG